MAYELTTDAVKLLKIERRKQREIGFNATHDDAHVEGEIARMAAFFAMPGTIEIGSTIREFVPDYLLGELLDSPKLNRSTPNTPVAPDACAAARVNYCELRIRDLVKSGACVLAEIERLQRVAMAAKADV